MDDSAGVEELNCRQCHSPVTFTGMDSVTKEDQTRFTDSLRLHPLQGTSNDSVHQTSMLGSFIDVKEPERKLADGGGLPGGTASIVQLFLMASERTSIEHPLCGRCLASLQSELQEQTGVEEARIQAYEEALHTLEAGVGAARGAPRNVRLTAAGGAATSVEQLQQHLQAAEREKQVEEERAERLVAELAKARIELDELEAQEAALKLEEAEYWDRYNALWLDLHGNMEEIEAIKTKTEVAAHRLDSLRNTGVLEEVFHIWFQERFGTISGFRLGRWKDDVKWSEVNAAWGQAVLLLDTMTRMYPEFEWKGGKLKPLASHSEISDGKSDHKLYGPVHKMWCGDYDKAMMLFLSCVDSFARFARERDVRACRERRTAFVLPNPIDVEKGAVRGYSIRYGNMVGNHDGWNKALKLLLVNLKLLLHWVTKDQNERMRANPAPRSNTSA